MCCTTRMAAGKSLRPLRQDRLNGLRPSGGCSDRHERQLAMVVDRGLGRFDRRSGRRCRLDRQTRANLRHMAQFRQERGTSLRRGHIAEHGGGHGVEGPVTEGLTDQGVVARHRRRDHKDRTGTTPHDLLRGLRTVHSGHDQVHEHDVGPIFFTSPDRLVAVGGRPGDGMAWVAAHDASQGFRGDSQVVDNRNPHASASPISSRTA